jgi:hypothetical protein
MTTQYKARQGFSRYECIGRVIRTRLQKSNGKAAVLWFDVILSNVEGKDDNRKEVPFVARCKTFGNQAEFLGERWKNVGDEGVPKPRVHITNARPVTDPAVRVKEVESGREYNSYSTTYIVPPFGVEFLDAAPAASSSSNGSDTESPATEPVAAGAGEENIPF